MSTEASETYLSLPVPEKHYSKVVQYLGRLEAGEQGVATVQVAGLKRTPSGRVMASSWPVRPWEAEELTRLKQEVLAHRPLLVPLFEQLVEHPGQLVSMSDYELVSGKTRRQLRSALAGMSQYIGKTFQRSNWPFGWSWNAGGSGEQSYTMDQAQAEAWASA